MTRVRLSSVLLGATALTLPLGMTAFAQQNQQAQQTQQTQQGQQAAAEQSAELGACERLLRLIEEATDEQLLADFEDAPAIAAAGDVEGCTVAITEIEQAGGISEEAVAEGRGIEFVTDTESFVARDTVTGTVQIETEAIVAGEVVVRQPIPEIAIEQAGPEVAVVPGAVGIAINDRPAEITIRQAPAKVTVRIPEPVITIEQPAPEIVLHMPPPGVSFERQPPRVTVNIPDPNVSVSMAEAQVTADVEARFLDPDEAAAAEADRAPRVTTVTELLDPAGNVIEEGGERAAVTVRKGEAQVVIRPDEERPAVRFLSAEPRVVFEQAEPKVEVAFAEGAQVEIRQVGEPTVRLVREDRQQAGAQGQQQAEAQQGQQQAEAQQGQQQGQQQTSKVEETVLATEEAATEAVPPEASAMLSIDEGVEALGEPQLTDFRVGDLSGTDVVTVQGDEVGDIDEIATSAGQTYAIIESGGFLGMGEEQIAIPLDRMAMRGDDAVLLGLTEEEIERIAEYDFAGDAPLAADETIRIGRFE